MSYQDIGKRIQQRRKELNLTQQELADRLQVTNKAISKWETGEGYPDISILTELSAALNVSVDELLGSHHLKETENTTADVNSIYRMILMGAIPLIYILPMVQHRFFFYGDGGFGSFQIIQRSGYFAIRQTPDYIYPQLATLALLALLLISLTHLIAYLFQVIKDIELFPWLKNTKIRGLSLILMSGFVILPLTIAVKTGLEIGMILLVTIVLLYTFVEIKALSSK